MGLWEHQGRSLCPPAGVQRCHHCCCARWVTFCRQASTDKALEHWTLTSAWHTQAGESHELCHSTIFWFGESDASLPIHTATKGPSPEWNPDSSDLNINWGSSGYRYYKQFVPWLIGVVWMAGWGIWIRSVGSRRSEKLLMTFSAEAAEEVGRIKWCWC